MTTYLKRCERCDRVDCPTLDEGYDYRYGDHPDTPDARKNAECFSHAVDWRDRAFEAERERDEARETNRNLNRRVQQADSELDVFRWYVEKHAPGRDGRIDRGLKAGYGFVADITAERERANRAERALHKINSIRNSIIGHQGVSFSEHVYPLVTALSEAGIEGEAYPTARGNVLRLHEQRDAAIAERDEARKMRDLYDAEVRQYLGELTEAQCGRTTALAERDRLAGEVAALRKRVGMLSNAAGALLVEARHHHNGRGCDLMADGPIPYGFRRVLLTFEKQTTAALDAAKKPANE